MVNNVIENIAKEYLARDLLVERIQNVIQDGVDNLFDLLYNVVDNRLNLLYLKRDFKNLYLEAALFESCCLSEEERYDLLVNKLADYIIESLNLPIYCDCAIKDVLKNMYESIFFENYL